MYIQQNDKVKTFNGDQQLQKITSEEETDGAFIRRLDRKRSRSASSRLKEQKQCRVSFNKLVRCIEVPHIDNLKKDIVDSIWLSEEEMRDIKNSATKIAKFMTENGEQVVDDTDEYCFRGLEYRTLEGNRNTRHKKSIVRSAVILQQQYVGGNTGRLAFASMRNSLASREEALERANVDELFARQYYLVQ